MNKKTIIIIFLVFGLYVNSFAFLGAITDTIKAGYDKAYQEFMKIKVIEQIRILKQNYDDSVRYYNYVKQLNEHKGGIAGYLRDKIVDEIDTQNQNAYWKFQNHMEEKKENTAYIDNAIKAADKKISDKLDYSKEIYELGKKRDEQLKDLAMEASRDKMTDTDFNKFNRKKDILTLQYLASIDKGIRQMNKDFTEQQQEKWEAERNQKIQSKKFMKELSEFIDSQKKQEKNQKAKDPYKILSEVPK